jgi:TolA-binding protein
MLPIGACLGVVVLGFIGFQTNNTGNDIKDVQSKITATQSNVTQITHDISSLNTQIQDSQGKLQPIQDQIDSAKADAATIDNLTSSLDSRRAQVNNSIDTVVALEPPAMTVSSVGLSENITLSGSTPDYSLVYQYARDLLATKMFSSVNIQSITFNGTDAYDFEMLINLK